MTVFSVFTFHKENIQSSSKYVMVWLSCIRVFVRIICKYVPTRAGTGNIFSLNFVSLSTYPQVVVPKHRNSIHFGYTRKYFVARKFSQSRRRTTYTRDNAPQQDTKTLGPHTTHKLSLTQSIETHESTHPLLIQDFLRWTELVRRRRCGRWAAAAAAVSLFAAAAVPTVCARCSRWRRNFVAIGFCVGGASTFA